MAGAVCLVAQPVPPAPAPPPPQAPQQPVYKVGTVTIRFVGTANVNEQVVRANMQIKEGG
jgi:outer membrane protein insertion porin family